MACERKLLESEATTGVFVLLGEQGNKAVLDWVMKEGLIPSRYESPKCKKDMRLVERKGTIDGFEWRCRVQLKDNPHFAFRSVRKGAWFSDSRLSICVILRLTRSFPVSMDNAATQSFRDELSRLCQVPSTDTPHFAAVVLEHFLQFGGTIGGTIFWASHLSK
ncbi:uncharacterized protein TNCV_4302491 [Trichonephila clavipes]|nr:uncharacterized protein TNCV_4302491 [Trichonephila clavipes]